MQGYASHSLVAGCRSPLCTQGCSLNTVGGASVAARFRHLKSGKISFVSNGKHQGDFSAEQKRSQTQAREPVSGGRGRSPSPTMAFLSLFIAPRLPHRPLQLPLLQPMKTEGLESAPCVSNPFAARTRTPAQMRARKARPGGQRNFRVLALTYVGRGLKGIAVSCQHVARGELEHQWDSQPRARGGIRGAQQLYRHDHGAHFGQAGC